MIDTLFTLIALIIVTWAIAHYLFDIRISVHTARSARIKAELRKAHEREIRRVEQERLKQIVEQESQKMRKEFQQKAATLQGYVERALTDALEEEVTTYAESSETVKEAALQAIQQSTGLFQTQQSDIQRQLEQETQNVKAALVDQLDVNLTKLLRSYVEAILRDEVDAESQIKTILQALENDKPRILRDLKDELK